MELDDYQFKTLEFILKNASVSVEHNAKDNNLNPETALRILEKVASDENYFQTLSDKQSFIFNKTVMPLISEVKCHGIVEGHCIGDDYLYGESLVEAYQYGEFMCSECSAAINRHGSD
ncbi:hypothetical protein ASC84_12165 [Acinetobacter sp. Root1280]|uniref:hypothetical protein n=1 Tax=Acinetobacter sp. Root1280 TaxID=1736444 RepID=UPI0007012147|nr:hypothetical protein [Acinetobacter sp. Root1280]KQW88129.1 hypothetical protein ASC84_12165 [Acinetobacter sp. Root1280]